MQVMESWAEPGKAGRSLGKLGGAWESWAEPGNKATLCDYLWNNSALFLLDFTFPVKEHVEIGEHLGLFDFRLDHTHNKFTAEVYSPSCFPRCATAQLRRSQGSGSTI